MTSVAMFITICVFSTLLPITLCLQCYQCGQYNDGVGSITPCINETHMILKECPKRNHVHCIKYVSEGSTVRDCVPECTQREDWGSKTYCCDKDGCNGAFSNKFPTTNFMIVFVSFPIFLLMH